MLSHVIRPCCLVALAVLLASPVSAEDPDKPDVGQNLTSRDVLLNSLLPGTAQIKLGRRWEGILYLTSIPLTVTGIVLQTHYLANVLRYDTLQRYYTDESGERPFEHPAYWSGFVLIGEPS